MGIIAVTDHEGVAWYDAPVPRRWHRCIPQTLAVHGGRLVERCACGGIRIDGPRGPWMERNSRRRVH
jgi:hypothetical protein